MIDQAVQFRLAKTSHLDDWQLLCKHASGLSSLRNQVAHATMLNYNNACVLQPYFGSTAAQPYLSIDDVKSRVLQFHELASCLDWFHSTVIAPLPSPLHLGPEPDLLARLRSRRA